MLIKVAELHKVFSTSPHLVTNEQNICLHNRSWQTVIYFFFIQNDIGQYLKYPLRFSHLYTSSRFDSNSVVNSREGKEGLARLGK